MTETVHQFSVLSVARFEFRTASARWELMTHDSELRYTEPQTQ